MVSEILDYIFSPLKINKFISFGYTVSNRNNNGVANGAEPIHLPHMKNIFPYFDRCIVLIELSTPISNHRYLKAKIYLLQGQSRLSTVSTQV